MGLLKLIQLVILSIIPVATYVKGKQQSNLEATISWISVILLEYIQLTESSCVISHHILVSGKNELQVEQDKYPITFNWGNPLVKQLKAIFPYDLHDNLIELMNCTSMSHGPMPQNLSYVHHLFSIFEVDFSHYSITGLYQEIMFFRLQITCFLIEDL